MITDVPNEGGEDAFLPHFILYGLRRKLKNVVGFGGVLKTVKSGG